ncbi:hypothetical protein [Allokutzneria sp. NRRL B-24872]|uniref:hypothetical protein n=1 Tax=Allokutzneria sp. NRRL B-24872 TaxID=1137961 RepID=UPI000A39D034|nr:hypothetical protein [Allokutzneria sp. NRRL B-24872]
MEPSRSPEAGTATRLWQQERTPQLNAVLTDVISTDVTGVSGVPEVWALGFLVTRTGHMTKALRRDGAVWREAPVPDIGRITAATAAGAELWAAGDNGGMLHHYGTGWRRADTPFPEDSHGSYLGMTEFGPDDVWAVGDLCRRSDSHRRGIVQRWDGRGWSELALPDIGEHWGLSGISGTSATNVWAVGWAFENEVETAVVLHFDGDYWQRFDTPVEPGLEHSLQDVAMLPDSGDAVAVGYRTDEAGVRFPLTMAWSGSGWRLTPSPSAEGQLNAVDGRISVGFAEGDDAYAAHLGTGAWHRLRTPRPLGPRGRLTLNGVLALPDGGALAVGVERLPLPASETLRPLVLHCSPSALRELGFGGSWPWSEGHRSVTGE